LDYLDQSAARKLIREPMIQMLHYDDCTVDRITHMTAGHPYYLQSLLHRIVGTVAPSEKSASIPVTADHIEAIIPELLDEGNYLFNDLLREPQGGRSRAILSALAHAKRDCETGATVQNIQNTLNQRNISIPGSQLSRLLEFMCSVGTIKCSQKSGEAAYSVRVPLFDRWLVEAQPLG
jgi:hypothetical protein